MPKKAPLTVLQAALVVDAKKRKKAPAHLERKAGGEAGDSVPGDRLNLVVKVEVRRDLKILAAQRGVTMKRLVLEALRDCYGIDHGVED